MEKALSVVIITERIKRDNWDVDDVINEFGQLISSARVKPKEKEEETKNS